MPGARSSELDKELAELARKQFGVFSRAQVLTLKGTRAQIEHRLATGRWDTPMLRVYRIGGATHSREQSAMTAVLWAGDGVLVSHSAAGVLWDFEGVRARKMELWVPSGRRLRSNSVVVHRGTRLDRADRTMLGPIAITTPTRTLIDVAGRLEDHRLLALTEDLIRRKLVSADRLLARLGALRTSGRPGAGRLEALLDARGDGRPLESALETLAWPIICRSGVPLPKRQHWVALPGGRYRLDFAWPELELGIECEGFEHHGGRTAWGKDRERFAEFVSVDWRILPLTWEVCRREPERVIRWIRRLHASQDSLDPGPDNVG